MFERKSWGKNKQQGLNTKIKYEKQGKKRTKIHTVSSLLTSFVCSTRGSIYLLFLSTDPAPSLLGLYNNRSKYFPIPTSLSIYKKSISSNPWTGQNTNVISAAVFLFFALTALNISYSVARVVTCPRTATPTAFNAEVWHLWNDKTNAKSFSGEHWRIQLPSFSS